MSNLRGTNGAAFRRCGGTGQEAGDWAPVWAPLGFLGRAVGEPSLAPDSHRRCQVGGHSPPHGGEVGAAQGLRFRDALAAASCRALVDRCA